MLREPIASGGMATVWKADDAVLGRSVAVKLLHPHLAGDHEFVERFRDEAKAAARLSHPSIVAIYDTASEDGLEAIVMELIEGITLRQYLDDFGMLSIEDAVDLARQVADALEAAHAARLVHRDIKPGNILLCPDRRIKVTDFGIAKALEGADRTTSGTLLGTAKYLAPEQVEGTPVDERADLYSLGIVLFEALTGQAPFHAETDSATALARLRIDPPLVRASNPNVSVALERVVLTAMARDRTRRFPSAAVFSEALDSTEVMPDIDLTVAPTIPMVDQTPTGQVPVTAGRTTAPPSRPTPGAQPNLHRNADPRRHRRRGGWLVAAVVAGCLALGMGLILATGPGRDFADRVIDALRGATNDDPEATEATEAIAPEPDSDGLTEEPKVDRPPKDLSQVPVVVGPVIAQVIDFDPLGDGMERPDLIAFATDANPATAWTSEGYINRSMGNLKEGVGIIVVLDGEDTLSSLGVSSPTQGWAGRVFAADAPAASLTGWGDALDTRSGIAGDAEFDLHKVRAGAVLLWITDLGDAPPQLRIEIVEVVVS
jgi:tRNA A-37 threonylcarbamoyl transferase component Bud32